MTSTTISIDNFSVEQLEELKLSMSKAYNNHIKKNEIAQAEKLKTFIDKADNLIKKKIESTTAEARAATEPIPQGDAGQSRIETTLGSDNNTNDISIAFERNNEELKTKFLDQEDYYKFDRCRRVLNQYLRNWILRKSKHTQHYAEMNLKVETILDSISIIIDYRAKPIHRDILKKSTYSIGIKGDERRYCFDLGKLKQDFEF